MSHPFKLIDLTIPDEPAERCVFCGSDNTYYLGSEIQCSDCDEMHHQLFQLHRDEALERLYHAEFDLGICRP